MISYLSKYVCCLILSALSVSGYACDPETEKSIAVGVGFLDSGQLDSAEVYFRAAKSADADCHEARLYLGKTYLVKAQTCKKERRYNEVGAILGDALDCFKWVIRADTANTTALINAGMVYYELNQFTYAKFYFKKALRIKCDNAAALQNLGNVLFWLNKDSDYNDAIEYWKRALDINPHDSVNAAVIWENIGIAFYKTGCIDSAVIAYGRAFEYDKSRAGTHVWYGRALATLGNLEKAINRFKAAIEIDSNCVEAYGAWAEVLYTLKDDGSFTYKEKTKELKDRIGRVLKSDSPDKAKYHLYLGHILLAERKYNQAEIQYDKARKLDSLLHVPVIE